MSIATWEFESPPLHLFAEIAQLVEHNLAKVGVASSSLVFRSETMIFYDNRIKLIEAGAVRIENLFLSDICCWKCAAYKFTGGRERWPLKQKLAMNVYVRYFDKDTLAYNVDEVIEFLSSIPEIQITQELVDDIVLYVKSEKPYPKRYKIRPRVYFILIKTTAQTLDEFKANKRPSPIAVAEGESQNRKEMKASRLCEEREGWYQGTILFKRVIQIPGTTKFQYQDTTFVAQVKADSGQHCYNRIVEHLKNRQDVDLRSQFPSARGANFEFEYLGEDFLPVSKESC